MKLARALCLRPALLLALALQLLACGDSGDDLPAAGRQRLRGFVVVGPELWAFQRCGSAALSSVDIQGSEPGIEKLNPLLVACASSDSPCAPAVVYVDLDAVVSDRCPCGHLGTFERELRIQEILAAAANPPPDCEHLAPRYPQ